MAKAVDTASASAVNVLSSSCRVPAEKLLRVDEAEVSVAAGEVREATTA